MPGIPLPLSMVAPRLVQAHLHSPWPNLLSFRSSFFQRSHVPTFKHFNDPTFQRSRLPIFTCPPSSVSHPYHLLSCNLYPASSTVHRHHRSPTFNFQPSNLQPKVFVPHPTAFVPQTTNVESPAITRNSPRIQPSKSQESDLFLEKGFLNLFLLKNPPSAG